MVVPSLFPGTQVAATWSAVFFLPHCVAEATFGATLQRKKRGVKVIHFFLSYAEKQPTQVGNLTGNALEEKLSREEVGKILDNLHLHQMASFVSEPETTGKDRLKAMKRKLQSPDKLRKASAVCLQQLASALRGGFNFGSLTKRFFFSFLNFVFAHSKVWKHFFRPNVCCLDNCLPSFNTMQVQR